MADEDPQGPGAAAAGDAVERLRSAAKWLLATFGAVGAATLGSLPFASFGTARPLSLAVAGAAVAVIAIVVAIAKVAAVLEAQERTPAQLEKDPRIASRVKADRSLTAGQTDSIVEFIAGYQAAEQDAFRAGQPSESRQEGTQQYADALLAAQRRDELRLVYIQLAELSLFEDVAARFATAKKVVIGAAVAVAVGAGCFAYATSRPAGDSDKSTTTVTVTIPHKHAHIVVNVGP